MPLVRRIRKRGANVVVEANAEVLFAPGGEVGRWTNRFSNRVTAATRAAAPSNKRPRWGHYGKPLKSTITSSTTFQPGRMKVWSAVGSSARHALYVDQGTGVYGGNGPYEAKILPPWERGAPSLYENTWRPAGPGTRRVAPVVIKGQRAQHFFDEGLKRGFQSMRMRSFQVPGEGQISGILDSIPNSLLGFLGNTEDTPAFRASLKEWRAWRDAAWSNRERLGKGGPSSALRAKAKKAGATKKRKAHTTSSAKPSKPKKGFESVAQKKAAAISQFRRQNPHIQILKANPGGIVVQTAKGPHLISWSQLYGLL